MTMVMVWISLPFVCNAQTENPRGVYKMTTLTGKMGEIKAPFDQYKICTDEGTLMVSIQNNIFQISNTDHKVFNYTGSEPKDENDKSTLIYDSDAEHFSEKWWSTTRNHMYFPENDWCIEKYQAGLYSPVGQIVFDALMNPPASDKSNPLVGTWRMIGYMDELNNAKKDLPALEENYERSRYYNTFIVVTPSKEILVTNRGGAVSNCQYINKKTIQNGNKTSTLKWFSNDCVAVSEQIDYRTDYQVWKRVTDNTPLINFITSYYLGQ